MGDRSRIPALDVRSPGVERAVAGGDAGAQATIPDARKLRRAPSLARSAERMKYRAFLSYSHADQRVAKRLHRALERYRLPRGVQGGDADRRLGRFCRDDDELAGSDRLGAALEGALAESQALVVVASPSAAQSTWVNTEVVCFKRRERAKVFAFVVGGSPNSDEPLAECFPPALRWVLDASGLPTERRADPPLAPDVTREGFSRAFVRLVAGLLAIPFDDLWQRERRRRSRRRWLAGGIAGIAALVLVVASAQVLTASDVAALRARSVELSTERWQRFREGREFDTAFRAALGAAMLEDRAGAGIDDVDADEDPIVRALAASGRALPSRRIFGSYPDTSQRNNFRDDIPGDAPAQRVAIRAGTEVRSIAFSHDSRCVGLSGGDGSVVVIDLGSGQRAYDAKLQGVDVGSRIALDELGSTAVVSTSGRLYVIDVLRGTSAPCSVDGLRSVHEIAKLGASWVIVGAVTGRTVVADLDTATGKLRERGAIPEFTPYSCNALSSGPTTFVGYESWSGLTPVLAGRVESAAVKFEELAFGVGQVKALAVDASGDLVALGGNGSGGGDRAGVQIVSLSRGMEVARLIGHTGEVYALDFMPRADVIASGGSDFSVRLWRHGSGREIARLAGHLAEVQTIRFSPDGRMLATSAPDGMVLLWDVSRLRCGATALLGDAAAASTWDLPSSVVTAEERRDTAAFRGRPADLRDWRAPWSASGIVQSVRALLLRAFG